MKANNYLSALERALCITNDCFCEALLLIAEFPEEHYEQAVDFCKECIGLLEQDLDHFKREVLQINPLHHKLSEGESDVQILGGDYAAK